MTSRCAAQETSLQNDTHTHKSSVKLKMKAQESRTMKTFRQSKRGARQSRQGLEHLEVGATETGGTQYQKTVFSQRIRYH